MIDESKCYEILGVAVGASRQELKTAYRDLAKVWHPDRFLHDPQLQLKAQQKLSEINEAYELVISGKAKRRTANASDSSRGDYSYEHPNVRQSDARAEKPFNWQLIVVSLLIFGVLFFFTARSLNRQRQQQLEQAGPVVESTNDSNEVPQSSGKNTKESRESNRNDVSDVRQEVGAVATSESATVQPMATATVTIDPTTKMLARRECPAKSTVTYPKGNEPTQYCNVHLPIDPAEAQRSNDSRIKSVAKRIASPSKWFDSKEKSQGQVKQEPKPQ